MVGASRDRLIGAAGGSQDTYKCDTKKDDTGLGVVTLDPDLNSQRDCSW